MSTPIPVLSPIEARVLAVLVEKELTVPDTYPLTLNSLVTGCNQKTSRDPVMNVTEAEAQQAIDQLRSRSLVIESSGSRVMRFSQNVKRVLGIPTESVALLAVLMLRGPQTSGELRINCERLQRFSDISAVEGFLDELAGWSAGALVVHLPRQPGMREARWAHLLCGPFDMSSLVFADDASEAGSARGASTGLQARVGTLEEEVAGLRGELAALRATVQKLCSELGMS